MRTTNLLTIGKLSKMTNVHIKALRYYEKIGILPPTYVDPDNGYRYYSLNHIYLVDAIRICAQLNIPLKQFTEFISEDGSKIHLEKLINFGVGLVEEKLQSLQKDLEMLKDIQNEIQWADNLQDSEDIQYISVPESYYWIVPFNGEVLSKEYLELYMRETKNIMEAGMEPLDEMGKVYIFDKEECAAFLCIGLRKNLTEGLNKNILCIPSSSFMLKKVSVPFEILSSFPNLEYGDQKKVIFEFELYTNVFDSAAPEFELRCSLPSDFEG